MKQRSLAILADYLEESWPSMDLCAAKLCEREGAGWEVDLVRPSMVRRWSRTRSDRDEGLRYSIADRLINRQWDYPRFIRKNIFDRYDFYHVVDHSYAHLVHSLPAERTGVYCHDIDAFRCLVEPERVKRPWWFRQMSRRILSGMQKAAVVFFSTMAVKAEIAKFSLVDEDKLVYAPLGVDEVFQPSNSDVFPAELASLKNKPWLLHVGATIPRKRIDLLIDIVAQLRQSIPELKLCKVGSEWTDSQRQQIAAEKLDDAILHLGKVNQELLVAAYQSTHAVLIPSDAEGFGLPVIEALACGAPVIASDIPVLRESGGDAAIYARIGDVDAWCEQVRRVLCKEANLPSLEQRVAWSQRFRWSEHRRIIFEAYERRGRGEVLGGKAGS